MSTFRSRRIFFRYSFIESTFPLHITQCSIKTLNTHFSSPIHPFTYLNFFFTLHIANSYNLQVLDVRYQLCPTFSFPIMIFTVISLYKLSFTFGLDPVSYLSCEKYGYFEEMLFAIVTSSMYLNNFRDA